MFCSISGTKEARKHFQTALAHEKYSSSIEIKSIAASGNEIVDALVTQVSHTGGWVGWGGESYLNLVSVSTFEMYK